MKNAMTATTVRGINTSEIIEFEVDGVPSMSDDEYTMMWGSIEFVSGPMILFERNDYNGIDLRDWNLETPGPDDDDEYYVFLDEEADIIYRLTDEEYKDLTAKIREYLDMMSIRAAEAALEAWRQSMEESMAAVVRGTLDL